MKVVTLVLPICIIVLLIFSSSGVTGWSVTSSFLGRSRVSSKMVLAKSMNKNNALVMYDSSGDPPSTPDFNSWTVLAHTERWISSTLSDNSQSASSPSSSSSSNNNNNNNNPYARKEVSYACETSGDSALIVATIFRRLKDVRELGERHGQEEEERRLREQARYESRTLRQTQVVVIPGSPLFSSNFKVFDQLIEAINQARRNARDYITDVALEKLDDALLLNDEQDDDDDDDRSSRDWSVSVNLAHLHPNYGEKTPEELLQEMKEEEEAGEVDVHYQEYKQKRLLARRSPYPTVVIEVRSVPPPDFSSAPRLPMSTSSSSATKDTKETISSADVQRLEALFGKSAHFHHPTQALTPEQSEDAFYSRIGKSIQELSALTPLRLAQEWLVQHDPQLPAGAVTITESPAVHVDAAYAFVFTNLAMMMEGSQQEEQTRQYLVFPHFLSSSATSFEKFATEVNHIVGILPDLAEQVRVSTFHPEHIDPKKRSPVPICVLKRYSNDVDDGAGFE